MTKPIGVGVPLLILACVAGIVLFTVSPTLSGLGLASAAVVIASCWFMHRVAGLFNLRSMSIPAFSFLVYMAVIAIPALVVYGDQIEPYRSQYLVSVQSVLITMPLGIWIAGKAVGFRREEATNFFRQPPASGRLAMEAEE
jgi:cytochrome bd-type quinol oxidase subunit 2